MRSCAASRCRRVRCSRAPESMPRYKLILEYDGSGLVGWQRQANGLSVQEILEIAAERFCGKRLTVHGAGRTDAGVHALAQAAHLDLPKESPTDVIRNALNQHVKPHAVSVLAVERVADNFDARRLGAWPRLSLSHPQSPRAGRGRARPRLACRAAARCRGDARRRERCCWASMTSRLSATATARRARR